MQCIDCKRYRHPGPCEPYMSDMDECEMDYLETLAIDAAQAAERYETALREKSHEHRR